MTLLGFFQSARLWTLLAFTLGLLPLSLTSTEMWDGVVGMQALQAQDWPTLKAWLLDSNWYLTYGIFLIADAVHSLIGLPYWVFFKLWILLIVAGIAFEVKTLATQVFDVPEPVAAWLPALVFSFPLWYVFFSYTPMLGHLTCVLLALTGYRLVHAGNKAVAGVGLVLVSISFQLASNCAFILAIETARWALSPQKKQWSYSRSAVLLLASITVFAATRLVWVPEGTYVGYNQFLNPLALSSWLAYAKYSVFFGTWLVLLAPVLAGFWYARRAFADKQDALRRALPQTALWPKAAALVWIALAACAPYIVVGLGNPLFTAGLSSSSSVSAVLASNAASLPVSVWYGGWGSRHVLLLMVALVVCAGWLMGRAYCVAKPASAANLRCVHISLIAAVCLNLAFCLPGHWAKLERLAEESTVVAALAAKPPLPPGQVELVLEQSEDYLNSVYEANHLLYRAYQAMRWTAVMLPDHPAVRAWGDEHRQLTLAQPPAMREKVARLNLMVDYDWSNPCLTVAKVTLPKLGVLDVLWRAKHAPQSLPSAQLTPVSSTCSVADAFWKQRSGY